jgi:hypothetical protein
MKSKIAWTILSGVLGNETASRVVQFFSQACSKPYPLGAHFCPNCGQKILSVEEQEALIQADVAAWKAEEDTKVAAEEAAAWEERRRELEMVYH